MHFVTGGAFNGKGKWVYEFYHLDKRKDWVWQSNYKHFSVESFAEIPISHASLLIVNGLEIFVKNLLHKHGEEMAREIYRKFLNDALEWEKQDTNYRLILIGNDITKGIVPMSKEERLWRDYVGWCYQDTVKKAKRVDVVWYGISDNVKYRV